MKGIYLVAVLFATTLVTFTLGQSLQDDKIPTKCPDVDPKNTTIHLAHCCDCTKFYMCLMGEKIEMQCPYMDKHGNRLHFNPRLQVCDWPYRAGCKTTGSTTTTSTTTSWITPSDTTTTSTITITGSTTEGSDISTTSLTPSSTAPIDDSTTTIYITPTSTKGQETTTPKTIIPTIPTEEPPTEETSEPSSNCPSDTGGRSIKIPHESVCRYYYVCTDGEKILQECAPGTVFDPLHRVCDFPENVNCEDSASTWYPDFCPKEEEGRKYQHETNCNSYYECVHSRKILRHCAPGLIFNVVLQTCDYGECTISTPKLPGSTTTIKTAPTTVETPTTPPINDDECRDVDSKIKFPHETDCNLYYQCMNGRKVLKNCSKGLVFNPVLRTCDFPENVKECSVTTPAPSTVDSSTDPPNACPPESSSKLPHECDCTKYYICRNGDQILQICPRGLEYDYERATCDKPEVVKCAQSTPTPSVSESGVRSCAGKKDGTKIPHEKDCSAYYVCYNNRRILKKCNDGLNFNPILQVCDFPDKVVCESTTLDPDWFECPATGQDRIPYEGDCRYYYDCDNGNKILNQCPRNWHFNPTIKVCDWPENYPCDNGFADESSTVGPRDPSTCIGDCPWEDPANYTVLIPNVDCHRFCMCSNGIPYVQDCPSDLRFDYLRLVCDYGPKVHCKVPSQRVFKTDAGNEYHDVGKKNDWLSYVKEDNDDTEKTQRKFLI